jgi:hypothetical protein
MKFEFLDSLQFGNLMVFFLTNAMSLYRLLWQSIRVLSGTTLMLALE